MCAKKKDREDNPETNETVYLQGRSRRRWKEQGNGKRIEEIGGVALC